MSNNDEPTNLEINNLVEIRSTNLGDGIPPLFIWPRSDHGAWYGPVLNWNQGHKDDYFRHVKKYDLVITAGANCGLHTRVYGHKFKKVYAFEPEWLNFYCLVRNCPEENIIKMQAALGEKTGFSELYDYPKDNLGTARVNETDIGTIPILTIDSFNFPTCDLIQLDVEGYEEKVINGARNTIEKYHPVIAIETVNDNIRGYLYSLGYKDGVRTNVDWIFYKE